MLDASAGGTSCRQPVIAVVVTCNRPDLLKQCLHALLVQSRPPDDIIVVDNASGAGTAQVLAGFPGIRRLRQETNLGGAGGFHAGIAAALSAGAAWVWLMDDDGRAGGPGCLAELLDVAERAEADLAAPLVVDAGRRSASLSRSVSAAAPGFASPTWRGAAN